MARSAHSVPGKRKANFNLSFARAGCIIASIASQKGVSLLLILLTHGSYYGPAGPGVHSPIVIKDTIVYDSACIIV